MRVALQLYLVMADRQVRQGFQKTGSGASLGVVDVSTEDPKSKTAEKQKSAEAGKQGK